jgi:hypothetical protein
MRRSQKDLFFIQKMAQRQGSSKWIILDTIECTLQSELQLLVSNIRNLAGKLASGDPVALGLLNRKGAVKKKKLLIRLRNKSSPSKSSLQFSMTCTSRKASRG